jgi:hypothetical protein
MADSTIPIMLRAVIRAAQYDYLFEDVIIEVGLDDSGRSIVSFKHVKYADTKKPQSAYLLTVLQVVFEKDGRSSVLNKGDIKRKFGDGKVLKRFTLITKVLEDLWKYGYSKNEIRLLIDLDAERRDKTYRVQVIPYPYIPDTEVEYIFDRDGELQKRR